MNKAILTVARRDIKRISKYKLVSPSWVVSSGRILGFILHITSVKGCARVRCRRFAVILSVHWRNKSHTIEQKPN